MRMHSLSPKRSWPWLGVVAMVMVGALLYGPMRGTTAQAQNQVAEKPNGETIARMEAISDAFKNVARKVRPAVVQITSKVMSREPERPGSLDDRGIDPDELPAPFREFFKEFEGRSRITPPRPRTGTGSGFIIDAEKGLIVTNNHVIGGSSGGDRGKRDVELWVTLADGRRNIKAKVVGVDPLSDIALIQIKADNLTAIPLGDSAQAEVGDWVLAIGSPFGLDQTVTQGIISATGRRVLPYNETIPYQDWLQTDAAINPGNSGGPLVNMRGEVVGINVAIATSGLAGGYQGVGFAIPVNTLKHVLPDLREGREVVRGYLGVSIQGLEDQPGLAETFGLKPDQSGVLIEDVQPRTPASKAGLKNQDVVLSYDGKELKSAKELQAMVARTKPGTKVELKVWREGKEITIPVTIEKQPPNFFARDPLRGGPYRGGDTEEGTKETIDSLGLTVEQLTPELANKFGIEGETRNQVVVTEVEPMGEAAALGLSPGDVIVRVQDKAIKNTRELRETLSDEALERGLRMQVRTRAGYRTLFMKLSPAPK
jgi:serine protease Do